MSENYGKCQSCSGEGEIWTETRDTVLHSTHKKKVYCGSCGGTGFSGDTTLLRHHQTQEEWEDYLRDQTD